MLKFNRNDYLYTPLFCEENIWHLAQALIKTGIKVNQLTIIFLSNKNKRIALKNQRATELGQTIVWDYHVILMVNIKDQVYILDFDSRLNFPEKIESYLSNSFSPYFSKNHICQFRSIAAQHYLDYFYSDRSHMKGMIKDSDYPAYPAIMPKLEQAMSLSELSDFKNEVKLSQMHSNYLEFKQWAVQQSAFGSHNADQ